MSVENDLLLMKKKVESAKSEKSRAEGGLEETRRRLKDEFGFDTEEEIIAEMEKLAEAMEELDYKLEEGVAELKERMNV